MLDKPWKKVLVYSALTILALYFFFAGLVYAQPFLVPITLALLLTMLVLPLARKLEEWGISRGWATLICDLLLLILIIGLFFLLFTQVQRFVNDWPKIQKQITEQVDKLEDGISEKTGIEMEGRIQLGLIENGGAVASEEAKGANGETTDAGSGEAAKEAPSTAAGGGQSSGVKEAIFGVVDFLAKLVLVLIYVFFILMYRQHLFNFVLRLIPDSKREASEKTLQQSVKVAQHYLLGRLILIVLLAVLYAVGFSITGVQHAIFVSVIAALLSLAPYVGVAMGGLVAIGFALLGGASTLQIIGVIIVYQVIQFIESYILEPFIVGHQVNLHPMFIIIGVVLGGVVWGPVGMVLAIPLLAIVKVVFDHVPVMEPFGFLLGVPQEDRENSTMTKVQDWVKEKWEDLKS